MKLASFYLLSLSVLTILLFSCTGEEENISHRTPMPARFELPFNNTSAQRGQTIRVEVEIQDAQQVKELTISTKDTVIYKGKPKKKKLSYEINTSNWHIGTNQLTLETNTIDGKIKRSHRIVKILSDVYPQEYSAEVLEVYPHQTSSYTQGLEFDGDQLYEGTGGRGSTGVSMILKVDLKTGKTQQEKTLEENYFGEGITILGDHIFQLTWQEHTCFVYDKNTLEELKKFTYSGEGWGLCNNGKQLIMSDGSERIHFINPKTFRIQRTIEVYSNEGPIKGLNELEYIEGNIYANVYTKNYIVIIDPATGIVTGKIDASLLALDFKKTGEVLNGIAYKKSEKEFFVTGKNWPNVLEIGLVKQ